MKGIKDPPDGKTSNVMKNDPKRDKAAEARVEERERRYRAFQDGLRAIVSEMKRVTWPSREEWVSATLVTIGLVLIVAVWTTAIGQLAVWIFKTGQ
ncbi:MAG TPA: preprotein translocase subunit SecE [Candidatus Eremiobacteraceae bacterium]|nr:preprotein translocase subunit SecE [Candidatus Eremiobacteraceae bacterium]